MSRHHEQIIMSVAETMSVETVFIVDDDESICEAICNLLDSTGTRAKHFRSAEEFLDYWSSDRHGCLVLDVRLPGMTGTEFQEKLGGLGIRIPIIFMTSHGDIPMVKKVMKAGAIEFLTKPFQKEELLSAIQNAFEADCARRQQEARRQFLQARLSALTAREREVMRLVTSGYLNKQIAGELNLSEITVKLHRRQVMEKMQANSLADLVKMAAEI
jgi:FixJ family two-component response regulator